MNTPDTTPAAPDAPTTAAPAPRRGRTRTLLIAGGAILATALLAGGGVAVGAAIADTFDDDDDDRTANNVSTEGGARNADAAAAAPTDLGLTSAAALTDIIDAAAQVAYGDPVGIDAERDGSWDVQFRTGAGEEIEVRVSADGVATVTSTEAPDADDREPQGVLDDATVDALVTAALAEADGRITDLEIDDDPTSPYDVTVLTGDGRTVDIALDADLTVLAADIDD